MTSQANLAAECTNYQAAHFQASSGSGASIHPPEPSSPVWSVSDLEFPVSNIRPGSTLGEDDLDEPVGLLKDHRHEKMLSESNCLSLFNPSTELWATEQDQPPVAGFLHDGTRNPDTDLCDIDTFTGALLPRVEQPPTYKNPGSGLGYDLRGMNWRQHNMTAGNLIEKHLRRESMLHTKTDAPSLHLNPQNRIEQDPIEEDSWPSAQCLLRPATSQDFVGIAAIINAEMRQEDAQVLYTAPIGPQEIEQLYLHCQKDLRPFIVAVPSVNEFLDRSKWPEGADKEYKEFVRFKKLQQQSTNYNTVLGFAFVTEARMGLLATGCHGSRFTGRITVLVHPDHRRKLYGTALLDRILLSVSAYHRSLIDCAWECSNAMLIYEHPVTKNQRKYARLHIEGLFAGKEGEKETWVNKLLEKFEFTKAGRLGETTCTGSGRPSNWLDSVMWEHEARPVSEITEEEPQRRI
ncbi:hypothetical protein BGZ63DRAFT_420019 [Mariannaea sp. PMI_226]|nr:hypothetical protein BGZ63DRAFT_420019 [Mariannaea sp. PMI_226]